MAVFNVEYLFYLHTESVVLFDGCVGWFLCCTTVSIVVYDHIWLYDTRIHYTRMHVCTCTFVCTALQQRALHCDN